MLDKISENLKKVRQHLEKGMTKHSNDEYVCVRIVRAKADGDWRTARVLEELLEEKAKLIADIAGVRAAALTCAESVGGETAVYMKHLVKLMDTDEPCTT